MNNTVKCSNGSFIGKETEKLIVWRGIPYATQPVGDLRWKKALPAADDNGTYEAVKPGSIPIGPNNCASRGGRGADQSGKQICIEYEKDRERRSAGQMTFVLS